MPFDPLVLEAGTLRHSVTIQQPETGQDVSGAVTSWKPYATARAAIVPIRGTDMIRSGQDISQVFITVSIRWQPGITSAMRLVGPGGIYRIQAIENVQERNRRLNLTCLALGTNG